MATGQPTVRLDGVYDQVGTTNPRDVLAVPVQTGTMLINARTGTFNLLGKDNYVVDSAGGGVGLGTLHGLTGASGLGAGPDAYILRYAPNSTVSLVDEATVNAGARLERAVAVTGSRPAPAAAPRGFASLGSPVLDEPGSAAVSGADLWVLVGAGSGCRVVQLGPISTGNGLASTSRATLPAACSRVALEPLGPEVGVAWPGHVRLFNPSGPRRGTDVGVASTRSADRYLPVSGANGDLWFLSHATGGWSVLGISPNGAVTHQSALVRFGARADPVAPVESGGVLYTLDQASVGQPTLWTIAPFDGEMFPVHGAPTYPVASPSERAVFSGAQVLVDGPRVVFNNPGSLLAVVVFTDGSRAPVVVDKSRAMAVSATGPVDVNAGPTVPKTRQSRPGSRATWQGPCRSSSRSTRAPPAATPPRSRTPRRSPPSRPRRARP